MSLIKRMRKQRAVFWAQTTVDNFGKMQFAAPVEIACRWENRTDEYLDAKGDKQMAKCVVYVDRDMKPGDALMEGTLDTGTTTPFEEPTAYEVKSFESVPNIRAKEFLRTTHLGPWQS